MGALMKRLFGPQKYCAAVVAAAGSSTRMAGIDKMFCEIAGVPVLVRTLLALDGLDCIDDIVVAVREDSVERVSQLVREYGIHKVSFVVAGGATRLESVAAGVSAAPKKADVILIHDGARPLVTREVVEAVIACARRHGAATCAVPVKDTIKTAEYGVVTGTPERKTLFAVQTPQVFDADVYRAAVQNAVKNKLEVTDDCMVVEAMGMTVRLTEGSYENIKITTPPDLIFAEAVIRERES